MKSMLIRLGICGVFLNIVCFAGLYGIRFHLSMAWLVLLLYFIPGLLNGALFQNAVHKWKLKRQLVVFCIMAGVTCICYAVFAFYFEQSAGYENYMIGNMYGIQEVPENLNGRFFSAMPILTSFLFNLIFQIMIGGTRRVLTREEIDKIFDDDEKRRMEKKKRRENRK